MSERAVSLDTSTAAPPAVGSSWRWSTWSLTRKLPALTAAIVVIVVGASLALTYEALKRAREDAMHERLNTLTRQLTQTGEQTVRTRIALYRQIASDSGVLAALHAAARRAPPADTSAAVAALLRLRIQPDSSLPIELWTANGRRVVHVGTDVAADSLLARPPELRTATAPPAAPLATSAGGSDSVRYGALYSAGGRVYYWTVAPVIEGGRRTGYIVQQRAYRSTAQSERTIKEILGDDVSLFLHNSTDGFWSSYTGEPTTPVTGVDSLGTDYLGQRQGVGEVMTSERRVAGTPWIISLEAPMSAVLSAPRATLRLLSLISLVIASAGVVVAWLASRRITYPLVSLVSASEALARGDYAHRIPQPAARLTHDEVARLASSFNRMAAEIDASHRELEAQRDSAQRANRAKSDFLAVMSHELRTPLNAIGGYAEILDLGIHGPVTERQREALQRITRSQQMLLSLINDVLNFAKLDAGQVQYRLSTVRVRDVIGNLDDLVAPQLQAKELTYRLTDCDASVMATADPEKLQQVVLNLLSNAIKFTPHGGRIGLSCGTDGVWTLVNVSDTGVGIEADRIDSIFDPFVQVDRTLSRPHEGVGLGLSISRDLVRGMGGTLTVRSTPGVGSTFTVRLRRPGA
ncbi:MAG TPA: HAMP domain-containing sensor histidine kinase [Gemmatimonadaceae bacterium]